MCRPGVTMQLCSELFIAASGCSMLQAEVRALAKKMLSRKIKDDIIEAAYSRYAL